MLTDTASDGAGATAEFEGVALERIEFHGPVGGGNVTVTELAALPADAGTPPGDEVLYAADVSVPEGAADVGATVRITLANETLGTVAPERARVAHRTGEGWTVLDTRIVAAGEGSVTFAAETGGFSVIAVVAADEPQTTTAPEATTGTPANAATTEPANTVIHERTQAVTRGPITDRPLEIASHPGLGVIVGVLVVGVVVALQRRER